MIEPAPPSMGVHDFMQELDLRLRVDGRSDPNVALQIGFEGPVDVGILAVLVDVIGGIVVLRHEQPCGISTTEMTMHGLHRLRGPGLVVATARLVSITANRGCVEVDLAMEGSTRGSAASSVVFKRWPGVEIPVPEEMSFGNASVPVPQRLWERARIERGDDGGVAEVALRHELTNHVAALQGGVTAALLEAAGLTRFDATTELRSMTLTYLAQGRVGPFRATAHRTGPDADVIVATVIDHGNDDRPVARAIFGSTTPTREARP
jgi:acyl-coenzyme A thioesterase PaaI-like protein